jgi:hypothetical protein
MTRILVTNGGPHPPEKWAMTTAEMIFDIGSAVVGNRLIQAQKFQLVIAEILVPHHGKVQNNERSKLNEDVENILTPFNSEKYLDGIMKDIINAAKGTPWQEHFAQPEVQAAARAVIASHIVTAQHVERLWHADHHPDLPASQSYSDMFKSTE